MQFTPLTLLWPLHGCHYCHAGVLRLTFASAETVLPQQHVYSIVIQLITYTLNRSFEARGLRKDCGIIFY
jgi:hypothetical protein